MSAVELHFLGPKTAATTIALAHGAGVGLDSPFMQTFAEGLATAGMRVARFEFPYMVEWRTGKQRPPDRERRAVERVDEPRALLALRPVARVHPPRLEIGAGRDAADFAITRLARQPDFEIVRACRGETHIAGA